MGGRQSSYDPMFDSMLIDYFEQLADAPTRQTEAKTIDELRTADTGKVTGIKKQEVRRICAELPTFAGFARSIGFSTGLLREWESAHPSFADAAARARDIQEQLMIDRGLNGQYPEGAFVFVAQNLTRLRPASLLGGLLADLAGSRVTVTIETVGAAPAVAAGEAPTFTVDAETDTP